MGRAGWGLIERLVVGRNIDHVACNFLLPARFQGKMAIHRDVKLDKCKKQKPHCIQSSEALSSGISRLMRAAAQVYLAAVSVSCQF
jgi:hypothetical protein